MATHAKCSSNIMQRNFKNLTFSICFPLDDMLCEQLKHRGPKSLVWPKELMNTILVSKKFLKLWRKSKVIAILKTGKDSSLHKSCRPISLLCHTYKLSEQMILNRLNPITEHTIIIEQAGFDLENHVQANC